MGVSIVKGGWGMPHCCGGKCCYIPASSCCTGCDCGYIALAPAKAKASAVLAALAMMAARQVESDGSYQILLALSLVLTMMTAVLVAFSIRRTPAGITHDAGSLKKPLVHDHVHDSSDH